MNGLSDDARVIVRVVAQEALGVVVRVDVDLGERVVRRRVGGALGDARLQPLEEEFQAAKNRVM